MYYKALPNFFEEKNCSLVKHSHVVARTIYSYKLIYIVLPLILFFHLSKMKMNYVSRSPFGRSGITVGASRADFFCVCTKTFESIDVISPLFIELIPEDCIT